MDGFLALIIWLMYMIVVVGSTVLVAVLIANFFKLGGISWWAVVIVSILILNSLISGFNIKGRD